MSKPAQKLVRFDWAMKHILRDKANFDVLEGFLTSLLKEPITIDELLESESNQESQDQKFNRVDLKCKDSTGRQMIIEVQSQRKIDYFERILWGTSKALVESVKRGDDYIGIAKIISVSILFHELYFPEQNDDYLYYGRTDLVGCHNKKPLLTQGDTATEQLSSGDIFPEYYVICVNNFEDKIHEQIDEWVYIFKHETTRDNFNSPGIIAAEKKLGYLGMTRKERARYDADVDNASNAASIIATAISDGEKIGLEKGKAEGEAIGLEKGEAIGVEKGKAEVARNMLTMNVSLEVVEKATGIPAAELRKWSKQNE